MNDIRDRLQNIQYTASEIAIDCRRKKWKNEDTKNVEDLEYIERVCSDIRLRIQQVLHIIK